jgi:hypothetical protein
MICLVTKTFLFIYNVFEICNRMIREGLDKKIKWAANLIPPNFAKSSTASFSSREP